MLEDTLDVITKTAIALKHSFVVTNIQLAVLKKRRDEKMRMRRVTSQKKQIN